MGTKLIYTVADILPYFAKGPLSTTRLRDVAKLSESTARRLIRQAIEGGFLDRLPGPVYAIPDERDPAGDEPRRGPTVVGETPRDSGLVRLRELAKLGPVNPYVQLQWAAERA